MNTDRKYITEDFLLEGEVAKKLFHEYCERLPIIDYHCHLSPQEIYEDKAYENIAQVWLYGDHYKWRIMRACGEKEELISGSGEDKEKFLAYGRALEKSIGNPLHHWSHMELKKYFNYDGVLNERTAESVWDYTTQYIKENGLSARKIIESSNVEVICTTDDPVDDLSWHQKIKEEGKIKAKVLPAWRPDKALNIEAKGFAEYIKRLEEVSGIKINSLKDIKKALDNRMDFFAQQGCKVSDHGLDYVPYIEAEEKEIEEIIAKALRQEEITSSEGEKYKTNLLIHMAKEYRKRGWIMQLHYGCARNINSKGFEKLGPDTGFDAIGERADANKFMAFLDSIEKSVGLPKTIVYSLDPEEDAVIDTIIGGFSEEGVPGKMQHGSAWWFNDHKVGMEEQMTSLAARGVLGNFVGMLTDSRSFLSYARHDYFRRILCNMVGSLVEGGEYPLDMESLQKIVEGISYRNAKSYFEFD